MRKIPSTFGVRFRGPGLLTMFLAEAMGCGPSREAPQPQTILDMRVEAGPPQTDLGYGVADAPPVLAVREEERRCPVPVHQVRSATFVDDLQALVVSGVPTQAEVTDPNGVHIYDSTTGTLVRSLPILPGYAGYFWAKNPKTLVVTQTYLGAHLVFVNARTWKVIGEGARCPFGVDGLISRSGMTFFAVCDDDEFVYSYDLRTGKVLAETKPAFNGATGKWHTLVESADRAFVYHTIGQNNNLHAHSARTLAFTAPEKNTPHDRGKEWLGAVASADGRRILARDGKWIGFLNASATRRGPTSLRPHPPIAEEDFVSLGISSDGKWSVVVLSSVSAPGPRIYAYDANLKQVASAPIEGDLDVYARIGVSPDSSSVVFGSSRFTLPDLRPLARTGTQEGTRVSELPNGLSVRTKGREVSLRSKGPSGEFRPLVTLPDLPGTTGNHGGEIDSPWVISTNDGRVLVLPSMKGALQLVRTSDGSVLEWLEYYEGGSRKSLYRRSDGAFEGDEALLDCLPAPTAGARKTATGLLRQHLAK